MKTLKKVALYLFILAAVFYGYKYMTGKSITTLPQDIAGFFQNDGSSGSQNPKYLRDPAEREQIPKS